MRTNRDMFAVFMAFLLAMMSSVGLSNLVTHAQNAPDIKGSQYQPYAVFQQYELQLSAGAQTTLSFGLRGVSRHVLVFQPRGTASTCNVELDGGNDNVAFASVIVPSQACTSAGQYENVAANVSSTYGRINLSVASGSGSVVVTYMGFRDDRMGIVGADPCASSAVPKNSVPFTITTATTTALVGNVAGQSIYGCGFSFTMIATVAADTVVFEYGTGGTCTGPVALTGAYSSGILTNGAVMVTYEGSGGSIFKPTPVNNSLCILSTVGTGPSIAGVFTYVQM